MTTEQTKITIGILAEMCGVRIDTIRYYERFKLIHADRRSKSGYRLYNDESVRQVMFIKRAKELGFTLAEIKKLLALKSSKDATCATMLERTHTKILEAKKQVKELGRIEKALKHLSKICPGDDTPISQCPILEHLYPAHKPSAKRGHHG